MLTTVKRYTRELATQYSNLLKESPTAMFNHSLRYRDFLKEILTESEDHYLCAFHDEDLVAVLPTFVKLGPYGAAVNSLPFYGSHGGLVYREPLAQNVSAVLLEALAQLCRDVDAFTCTLIESPWETDRQRYRSFDADLFDERIGQITTLPPGSDLDEIDENLLNLYHQKTRNMVRKGLKGGFQVGHDGSSETISVLHAIHDDNMREIGGKAKPKLVFQAISKVFEYDEDYRIYTATKDGQIVSAMLVFYFKDTVEYFTPATVEAYRGAQPLSLLIFTAMRDAIVERNSRYWNWGGTWLEQTGVYQFKSRWGTTDYPYRYHVKTHGSFSRPISLTKETLLHEYPYFFTFPFHKLNFS